VVLECTEEGRSGRPETRRLVFSGDVGRRGLAIIRDPRPPTDAADVVVMESTYGDRDHERVDDARAHLARVVPETAARGGRVLVPAFESRALNAERGPMVVIAGSGMAESGRILHHLLHGADDPRNTVLIVGFQAEHTLGRRLVERRPVVRGVGEDVALRAHVEVLNGYSAHADRTELADWLGSVRAASPALGRVYLVHGERGAQDAFAGDLATRGYDVTCAEPDMVVSW
jgi:metallo-beta-lactamase family protein